MADDVKVPVHFAPVLSVAQKIEQAKERANETDEAAEQSAAPVAAADNAGGDLESKSVAELKKLAESYGIEVPSKTKKADIIALIRGE